MVNFSKFCSEVFTASPIDVLVLKCRKNFPTGNRRNRALFTGQKKIGFFSNCRYCADRAQKSARASSRHLAHNVPNFIKIRSLSAEL